MLDAALETLRCQLRAFLELHHKGLVSREPRLKRPLHLHLFSPMFCAMAQVLSDGKSLAARAGGSPQKGLRFLSHFSQVSLRRGEAHRCRKIKRLTLALTSSSRTTRSCAGARVCSP